MAWLDAAADTAPKTLAELHCARFQGWLQIFAGGAELNPKTRGWLTAPAQRFQELKSSNLLDLSGIFVTLLTP